MDIDGKEADMECMDIYIRVSRVGDRKGSSYRSPKQQEESCRGWAEQNGIEVGKVVTEENISGGKRAQDRKLEELLRRAEAGVSGGIIVYRINRFGRRMRDTVAAVGQIKLVNPDPTQLTEGTDGLMHLADGSEADADPTVSLAPGALEASNVNPSSELVKMISLSRQYEMQVRSIKTAEDDSDDSMKLLQTS